MPVSTAIDPGRLILEQVRAGSRGAGLEALSQPFAGHPGVWLWQGEDGRPAVVKCADPDDADAVAMVRREAGALSLLAPTGAVPELLCSLLEAGELVGFAISFVAPCPGVLLASPLAISAFAAGLAALHARTWRVPYPPFGLDVPLAMGGHTLWIGGGEILTGMCAGLRNGPYAEVALLALAALDLLATARSAMTERFAPEDMVLVHGDVAGGNLIFHRDGPVLTCLLIDLGEVVVAPPQYDLARYAVGAKLAADQEELLLSVYGGHLCRLTRSSLGHDFRDGFEMLKPFAVFDTAIAPYVIYAANGLPVDPCQALQKMSRGLASLQAALETR